MKHKLLKYKRTNSWRMNKWYSISWVHRYIFIRCWSGSLNIYIINEVEW